MQFALENQQASNSFGWRTYERNVSTFSGTWRCSYTEKRQIVSRAVVRYMTFVFVL